MEVVRFRGLYPLVLQIGDNQNMKFYSIKNRKSKYNKNGGFALLFTVVIVAAVSVITAGLTSTIYKQVILSSLAKDSSVAFYQADTASDCALYADLRGVAPIGSTFLADHIVNPWNCGEMELNVVGWDETPTGNYILKPNLPSDFSGPCFNIEVTRSQIQRDGKTIVKTSISAKGYNICDVTSPRTVEREIKIDYEG